MTRFIALLVLLVGFSPLGTPLQAPAQDSHGPRRIEIVARRFTFEPASITLKKGEPVVLVLKTSDVPHGVRFRDLNLEIKASKSGSGEVPFTPDKDGDFVGHCSVFCGAGHGSMEMTIHVIG
jgi:cytochrome c oxidase subunit 2